jgi:cold shock CspA family protein
LRQSGTVTEFDDDAGLGVVAGDGGPYPFHCTAIADGTRTIPAGTPVTFEVVAGHLGRWEAADIRPVSPTGPGRPP